MPKEAYQKFGIEGQRIDKNGAWYRVVIPLREGRLKTNEKYRARLLDGFKTIFTDLGQFPAHLICSYEGWPHISKALSIPAGSELGSIAMDKIIFDNISWYECQLSNNHIPDKDSLEELFLWAGAICTRSNLVLESTIKKVDPFVSVCCLPSQENNQLVELNTLRVTHGSILENRVCDLIEELAANAKSFYLVAKANTSCNERVGFLIGVDTNYNYVLINSSTINSIM